MSSSRILPPPQMLSRLRTIRPRGVMDQATRRILARVQPLRTHGGARGLLPRGGLCRHVVRAGARKPFLFAARVFARGDCLSVQRVMFWAMIEAPPEGWRPPATAARTPRGGA